MPKYTKSKDGVMRTDVLVKVRLNKDQYELLDKYAEKEEFDGVADVCRCEANNAVEGLISDIQTGHR